MSGAAKEAGYYEAGAKFTKCMGESLKSDGSKTVYASNNQVKGFAFPLGKD